MDTTGMGDQKSWHLGVSDVGCRPTRQITVKEQGNYDPPMNFRAQKHAIGVSNQPGS